MCNVERMKAFAILVYFPLQLWVCLFLFALLQVKGWEQIEWSTEKVTSEGEREREREREREKGRESNTTVGLSVSIDDSVHRQPQSQWVSTSYSHMHSTVQFSVRGVRERERERERKGTERRKRTSWAEVRTLVKTYAKVQCWSISKSEQKSKRETGERKRGEERENRKCKQWMARWLREM